MVDARKPTAAGVFYPASWELLSRVLADLLAGARVGAPAASDDAGAAVRAIVVPHGILGPAGPVAAAGWTSVAPLGTGPEGIARVVVLGPSHHVPFPGIAAPFADAFATPLGAVAVDRIAIERARRFPQFAVSDLPHEQEASLEVQVPFIQTLLPAATVVPLIVGELADEDAAEIVEELWDDATLVVVSSELSRYFDATTARTLDAHTASAIESLDPLPIVEERACGHAALRALLIVARARGMSAKRLALGLSVDDPEPLDEVVGYGAFAIG